MKIKGTIIIALIAIIGAVLFYFIETKYFKKEEKKKDVIVEFKSQDIKQFQISYSKSYISQRDEDNLPESIICEKNKKGQWLITVPKRVLADKTEIEMLLNNFSPLTYTKKISSSNDSGVKPSGFYKRLKPKIQKHTAISKIKNLTQFGLDKPKIIISLQTTKSKSPLKISIGNENPNGDSIYVRKNEEKIIYLIGSINESSFRKNVQNLRDKTMFSFKEEDVNKIEIGVLPTDFSRVKEDATKVAGKVSSSSVIPTTSPIIPTTSPIIPTTSSVIPAKAGIHTFFIFEKKGKEKWDLKINSPISPFSKGGARGIKINEIVENIILEINDLKGKEVVVDKSNELKKYGLDSPSIILTIYLPKIKRTLLFGNKKEDKFTTAEAGEGYYAKVGHKEEIFLIDTWKVENIKKEIEKIK